MLPARSVAPKMLGFMLRGFDLGHQDRTTQLRTALPDSKQNRSDAVMAQRGAAANELDDFPTPPWATRALITSVIKLLPAETVLEPAAGRGLMADVLGEKFATVSSFDIHDYGYCPVSSLGFLQDPRFDEFQQWDWVITNPPFNLAQKFIWRAFSCARRGVAMLCRTAIIEGRTRYRDLYENTPPSLIAQFVERVPMVEGQYDPLASTATSYAWLIWDKHYSLRHDARYRNHLVQTPLCWIPPCRKELERPWERINALLAVAENEEQKAVELGQHGTDKDAPLIAAHRAKAASRFQTACKELAAYRESSEWGFTRPLLRLSDGMVDELTSLASKS